MVITVDQTYEEKLCISSDENEIEGDTNEIEKRLQSVIIARDVVGLGCSFHPSFVGRLLNLIDF